MKTTVIATEILSILALLMLFYGSIFEVKRRIRKNRVYTISVLLCILALITDMLAWILDGSFAPEFWIFMSDLSTYVLGYVIIVSYTFYILETVREKKPVPKHTVKVILALATAAVIFVIVGSSIHKVFYIQEHVYHTGPWYNYTQIFTGLAMLYNLYLILSNAKLFGRHDTLALMSYIVFPIAATALHFVLPDISFTYIASLFSQITIYIMLQAEQEAEFRTRERILLEVSNTDTLTGLQNRRAYDEARFRLKESDTVNVLFLDINGLKYTNDNFGHKAGDELITGFSDILRENFSYSDIFRISGDEFVILNDSMSEKEFEKTAGAFDADQQKDGKPKSSIGRSRGAGAQLSEVVKQAEYRMYEDKEIFHNKYPDLKGR